MFKPPIVGVILMLALWLTAVVTQAKLKTTHSDHLVKEVSTMHLTSKAFQEGAFIPLRYTCDGQDISPPLQWSQVPTEAKSLVLICDDPDAPMGTWVHWIVVDLPPDSKGLAEGEPVPKPARELKNSSGRITYGGPCPPHGIHRYFFKLYALDVPTLEKVTPQTLPALLQEHTLAEVHLMGRYQRQQ